MASVWGVCRACLKAYVRTSHEFHLTTEANAQMYTYCTQLKVSPADALPKSLCRGCRDSLNKLYEFKRMCVQSSDTLLRAIEESEGPDAPSVKEDREEEVVDEEYDDSFECQQEDTHDDQDNNNSEDEEMSECPAPHSPQPCAVVKMKYEENNVDPLSSDFVDEKKKLKQRMETVQRVKDSKRPRIQQFIGNFLCSTCGETYTDKRALRSHIFEDHIGKTLNMEFSKTMKGKTIAIYMGYEYIKYREHATTDAVTWRCKRSRPTHCKAYLRTAGNTAQVINSHCHDPCPQKAQANIIMNKMKAAMKNAGAAPQHVIVKELSNVSDDILAYLPKQSSLERSLLRHRDVISSTPKIIKTKFKSEKNTTI